MIVNVENIKKLNSEEIVSLIKETDNLLSSKWDIAKYASELLSLNYDTIFLEDWYNDLNKIISTMNDDILLDFMQYLANALEMDIEEMDFDNKSLIETFEKFKQFR